MVQGFVIMASVSTTPLFDDLANSILTERYESTRNTGRTKPLEVYIEVYIEESYFYALVSEIENKRSFSNLVVEMLNYGTLFGAPIYQVRKVRTYVTKIGVPKQPQARNPPKYRIISTINK